MGYDSHDNLEFLAASGIEAALKVREILIPTVVGKEGRCFGPTSRTLRGGRSVWAMGSGGWPRAL